MNAVTHDNRRQRQKEKVRAGEEEKRVPDQAQVNVSMGNWMKGEERNQGGVDSQERVR